MGLDMYLFSKEKHPDNTDFSIAKGADGYEIGEREEIAYWRKHNALHALMYEVYQMNGGSCLFDEFNCVSVRLSIRNLNYILRRIEDADLTTTSGFFFGRTDYMYDYMDSYEQEKDIVSIERAIVEVKSGQDVYYNSWW